MKLKENKRCEKCKTQSQVNYQGYVCYLAFLMQKLIHKTRFDA